ncbi:MAG TPA: nitronate monooxygenase [Acidimicrobiales bacterium]|nr:nitronate monooxygenase [Acidimicrobiales bacterium]
MLGVDIPIMQAPMTYIAGAQLAAAVSNAGALGIIETASPQGRADLKRVRDMTDKPVGANLALAMRKDPSIVEVLVDAGIRFATTSAGDPALFTERLHDAGITVFHVIGTLRNAMKAVDAGVDGLVVEGVEGGGFKNPLGASTLVLLPLVASRVSIPIVAAGGICDGPSMAAALVLGAEGVQMGTRMLASRESPVHDNFKNSVVDADDTGTLLLSLPGLPTMRVIRTETAERARSEGRSENGLEAAQHLYFSGDMQASLANTGQVAGRIEGVESVYDIVRDTWSGCRQALEATRSRLQA